MSASYEDLAAAFDTSQHLLRDVLRVVGAPEGTADPTAAAEMAMLAATAQERRACISALCGPCASGREPQYRDARHQGLPSGYFHTANSVPGALIRCPASALWERGKR